MFIFVKKINTVWRVVGCSFFISVLGVKQMEVVCLFSHLPFFICLRCCPRFSFVLFDLTERISAVFGIKTIYDVLLMSRD